MSDDPEFDFNLLTPLQVRPKLEAEAANDYFWNTLNYLFLAVRALQQQVAKINANLTSLNSWRVAMTAEADALEAQAAQFQTNLQNIATEQANMLAELNTLLAAPNVDVAAMQDVTAKLAAGNAQLATLASTPIPTAPPVAPAKKK